MTIDGQQFMCKKHGIDYRLYCEECLEKSGQFNEITKAIIKENQEKNRGTHE